MPNTGNQSWVLCKSSMHSYYWAFSLSIPFPKHSWDSFTDLSNYCLLPRFKSCLCMSKSILGLPGTIPPTLESLTFSLGIIAPFKKILSCSLNILCMSGSKKSSTVSQAHVPRSAPAPAQHSHFSPRRCQSHKGEETGLLSTPLRVDCIQTLGTVWDKPLGSNLSAPMTAEHQNRDGMENKRSRDEALPPRTEEVTM